MQIPISRIAPTPSGYLHLGNIINFIYTWTLVRNGGGKLWLRIDDLDQNRTKDAYIEDIFSTLDWLGFDFDYGPATVQELKSRYSFIHYYGAFKRYVEKLLRDKKAYACTCSRKDLKEFGNLYPGFCRQKEFTLRPGNSSARIVLVPETINLEGRSIKIAEHYGDFVIWRKEDIPSYHLASTLFDAKNQINTIVRGIDLFQSTAAQLGLAKTVGLNHFLTTDFIHHRLYAPQGVKLSKSNKDDSIARMRYSGESKSAILTKAARFMGITATISTLSDFLPYMHTIKEHNANTRS